MKTPEARTHLITPSSTYRSAQKDWSSLTTFPPLIKRRSLCRKQGKMGPFSPHPVLQRCPVTSHPGTMREPLGRGLCAPKQTRKPARPPAPGTEQRRAAAGPLDGGSHGPQVGPAPAWQPRSLAKGTVTRGGRGGGAGVAAKRVTFKWLPPNP